MSRIPASAGVALVGLLPLSVGALGLGEVESKSHLNQPFAAEIPVFAEMAGELTGLSVGLASADAFSRHGLQLPDSAGDFSFTVATGAGGGVIHITSTRPITEPFITLLLEVQWPQGRLLREYTVLLDPPTFTGGAVSQPVQAAAPASPAVAAPVPVAAPEEAGPAPSAIPPAVSDSGPMTHTVAQNETLWRIAERYRADEGVGINQMMMAIYRANPQAFAGNINRLNAGAVLRIPDQATIADIGRGEAAAEVQRQTREWQEETGQESTTARLELLPPAEVPSATPAGTAGTAAMPSAEQEAENRRLLAVKDAELAALRKRVAELEARGGAAVPAAPPAVDVPGEIEAEMDAPASDGSEAQSDADADAAAAPAADAQATPGVPEAARPVRVQPTPPAGSTGSGIMDTLTGLLGSIWLWLAAAVVLLGALLLARRRSTAADFPARRPVPPPMQPPEPVQAEPLPRDDVIVTEVPAGTSGAFDNRGRQRDDEETPLERTISTDSAINLDQADPLAEAEFHVAYGLYDQAADILAAALAREPGRRDLQLKLLEVHFGWENREGFLQQARTLHARIDDDSDADWKRVCIMGSQLCPDEALFAGAGAPLAEDMDLALDSDSGSMVDLEPDADAGLDFDLSGMDFESDADAPTMIAPGRGGAPTQEVPTLEIPGPESTMETPTLETPMIGGTMETPTIESPELSATTLETPTLETPMAGSTMETPTLETPGIGSTARLHELAGSDEQHDQTAEIDLEELGLDLSGLDEAMRDMGTGLQEALPGDAGIDLDLGNMAGLDDVPGNTAEMEGGAALDPFNEVFGGAELADTTGSDETAEQPVVDFADEATMATQRLDVGDDEDFDALDLDLDLDLAEDDVAGSDLTSTGLRAIGGRRPEDPTMTEVGTKLDLARAYMDMDDREGARSILNEVLEEGDPAQRQEARQLLDGLDR